MDFFKPILAGLITTGIIFTAIMLIKPYVNIPGALEKILLVIGGLFPFAQSAWEKYLNSTGISKDQIKQLEDKIRQLEDKIEERLDELEQRILKQEMVTGNLSIAEITEGRRLNDQKIEKLYDRTIENSQRLDEIEKILPTKMV